MRPFLGLGGFLRDYIGVQPYEEVLKKTAHGQPLKSYERPCTIPVTPHDPHANDEYVIGVNIAISWHSPAIAAKYGGDSPLELDQDDMEETFRRVCAMVCVV